MFILVTSKLRCQVGIGAIAIADYFSHISPKRFNIVSKALNLNRKWVLLLTSDSQRKKGSRIGIKKPVLEPRHSDRNFTSA